jgi:23S rRNA (cytidine1920-2'-O)/16S rRNA (cytidine1409-2'-O)-methyltransferase
MKQRLDIALTERGLAETRARARALILAGDVSVNGQVETKAGALVDENAEITLRSGLPYVSRGGLKLAHALDSFQITVAGRVCLDVGASTGGFTDCLLQRGAARVYAVDVGYGQLDWKLRSDARVVVMERTNIRYLQSLPEQPDLCTVDVSFISLRLVLPVVYRLSTNTADCVALVKPQFEAGRGQVGKGGVVRDERVHRQVILDILAATTDMGWRGRGLVRSPITGPAGNVEFLLWLSKTGDILPAKTLLTDAGLWGKDTWQ